MLKIKYSKKWLTLMVVALCLMLSAVGARLQIIETVTSVFNDIYTKGETVNKYTITADFDAVEKIIAASETVVYTNNTRMPINAVYFHLYPNAFKTEDYTPFEKTEMNSAYPNGFEPGYIQIHNMKNGKEALNYMTMGLGDSILKVHLNKELDPGDQIEINMDFQVKMPPSCGRFGYGDNTINIANWYPIVSVFDHQGWNLEPYYAIGDPFYSDIGDYRVMLSLPGEYIVASTGDVIKKENIDGKVRWTIEGKKVRDFALIISDKFKIMNDEIDGIKIYSYHFEDLYGEQALQTAKDSIHIFNELFGEYPYKQFSVAASDFFIGGMEYPNLVYIDYSLYQEENKEIMEYVIAHEAAHQWWYGIVGNDEVDEPWLDEALTEYSTMLYYEKKYGEAVREEIYKNMIERYYNAYRSTEKNMNEKVCRSLKDFKNSREYQVLVYYKGAMFVHELRKKLGDDQFFQIMKVYFDKYKYKNSTTENFLEVCEKVSNCDLRDIFKEWLFYEKE